MKLRKRTSNELTKDSVEVELYIDVANLNDELLDQPLLYRKYSKLKSEAYRQMNAFKDKLEFLKSSARLEFKKSQVKSTVADVDAMIVTDPRVQEVLLQYREAEENFEALEGVVYALRQRHEALKELCANIRKEMAD